MNSLSPTPSPFEVLRARNVLNQHLPSLSEQREGDDCMSLNMLEGFLFGLACSPELSPPSSWIPFVIGDLPDVLNDAQTEETLNSLFTLYNHVHSCLAQGRVFEAHTVGFRTPSSLNAKPDAPAHHWSIGFGIAHYQNDIKWKSRMNKKEKEDAVFYQDMIVLGTMLGGFGSEEIYTELIKKSGDDTQADLEKFLGNLIKNFDSMLESYAASAFWFRGD